jgi:hypothetical protein
VLERGPKGKPPAAGGAPVVWWDPAVLALDVEELAPLRHQRILEADSDGAAAAESEKVCGMEGGARDAARKGLRAVAACPDRYIARPLRSREGCDRRIRFGCEASFDVERVVGCLSTRGMVAIAPDISSAVAPTILPCTAAASTAGASVLRSIAAIHRQSPRQPDESEGDE